MGTQVDLFFLQIRIRPTDKTGRVFNIFSVKNWRIFHFCSSKREILLKVTPPQIVHHCKINK